MKQEILIEDRNRGNRSHRRARRQAALFGGTVLSVAAAWGFTRGGWPMLVCAAMAGWTVVCAAWCWSRAERWRGERKGLMRRIEALNEGMEEKTLEAEQLRNLKDRFLAIAGTDVKGALNAIQSELNIILEGYAGETLPAQRRLLEKSNRQCRVLRELLADLADMAQLDGGDAAEEMANVDMQNATRTMLEAGQSAARERGVQLAAFLPESYPVVRGSARRMEQALVALLRGVVAGTPGGGKVVVKVRETTDMFLVEMTPTDCGARDREQCRHVGEAMLDACLETGATGEERSFAMTMARKIIAAQGGRLLLEHHADRACTVRVLWPKRFNRARTDPETPAASGGTRRAKRAS